MIVLAVTLQAIAAMWMLGRAVTYGDQLRHMAPARRRVERRWVAVAWMGVAASWGALVALLASASP